MRFAYLRDPLFLFCLVLYFANRWFLRERVDVAFLRTHLNDLICIPFWVPLMLFALRRLGLRRHDLPPGASEILVPLVLWSVVFELVLPRMETFAELAFADPADVLFYTLGALAASLFWDGWYKGEQ